MTPPSVGDRLREIDAAMTAAPWDYVPDECDGKEEAWGYWHRIGPISLNGKEGRPDTLGIRDIRNALPALAAHADAAAALRGGAVVVTCGEWERLCAVFDAARAALLAALDGKDGA